MTSISDKSFLTVCVDKCINLQRYWLTHKHTPVKSVFEKFKMCLYAISPGCLLTWWTRLLRCWTARLESPAHWPRNHHGHSCFRHKLKSFFLNFVSIPLAHTNTVQGHRLFVGGNIDSVLIEQGLTSHQTHYRSYRRRFLQVIWPNQQCQSTEGNQLVFQIRLKSHQDHSTMLQ